MKLVIPIVIMVVAAFEGNVDPTNHVVQEQQQREDMSIDKTHSNAHFRVQHLGAGRFWGRFNDVDGAISWTPGSKDDLEFDITIDVESVDSGVEQLDKHLKSPDFFNAKEFPSMSFKSTSASRTGDDLWKVKGDLTIHGVTRPITADVQWLGSNTTKRGRKVGFEASFMIKRSEFGMNYGVEQGALGDEVDVIVAMEANVR